jgi:hypothetical protein
MIVIHHTKIPSYYLFEWWYASCISAQVGIVFGVVGMCGVKASLNFEELA